VADGERDHRLAVEGLGTEGAGGAAMNASIAISSSGAAAMSSRKNRSSALACAAGYRSLYARTRPDNERSMAVLRRNGFRELEGPVGNGPEAIRTFVKVLEPPDAGVGRRT
jgi:hypothetical protein